MGPFFICAPHGYKNCTKFVQQLCRSERMNRNTALEAVIVPVVTGLGCEFVGLEYLSQGKHSILRIYIDRPGGGVTIDDCSKISRQVGSVLDVEADLVRGAYTLEVSSPGVDRKIFTLEQFLQFVGQKVQITVQVPLEGKRNFKGLLIEVKDQELLLDVNGKVVSIDYANVANANLIAQPTQKGTHKTKGETK